MDLGSRRREGSADRSARCGREFRALHQRAQPRRERLLVGRLFLARIPGGCWCYGVVAVAVVVVVVVIFIVIAVYTILRSSTNSSGITGDHS